MSLTEAQFETQAIDGTGANGIPLEIQAHFNELDPSFFGVSTLSDGAALVASATSLVVGNELLAHIANVDDLIDFTP